ncbi:sensor histidine kinase [Marinobacter fuscus]|uniref:C4-dicarboxylate transport sensor protein DctB n=1 Tax=Marinobacter fuscus TaxID=2109942 RepID=A0A2T1KLV3_9GAMM|nr:ATP-binding protein [Marinobacter fuscus]PSF10612.1 sensor histidine kinase [Marinobacter fuscus]
MMPRISVVSFLLFTLLLSWVVGGWFGLRQLERESQEDAFRYRQLVANELNRYLPVPELIAEHPLLAEALERPNDPEKLREANEQMQRMATIVGGSDVYLMDHTGLTIAANNYGEPDTFVGNNYSFRPYFSDAVKTGRSVVYFALGSQSLERGLYFSHPVRDDAGALLGVVTIKVLVHELESQWHRPESRNQGDMVVLDGSGVSFLTSQPGWLYRDFEATFVAADDADTLLRYPGRDLQQMPLRTLGRSWVLSENSRLLRFTEAEAGPTYLAVTLPLPRMDWSLMVLADTRPLLWNRVGFAVGGLAIFLAGFLTWLYLRERYRRERELALRGEQLEQRVNQRTADLKHSNDQLLAEIQERERAQTELRETQQELIQAAKLAVLGQMSAGLNHEINQPLTAIQAYARNSRKFLERGATGMVDANLREIVSLCDKMAELIRQFKVFARKSEGPPSIVDLRLPVDAALKIIRAQNSAEGVDIRWHRPEQAVMCHGDLIRVEQVMVNLMANAIQAVEGCNDPAIDVLVTEEGEYWQCLVRDNGHGLPGNTEQVFEPFFTTRSVKQGLGLGLSISRQIVDALGGTLTGQNRTDGPGAEFSLKLKQRRAEE